MDNDESEDINRGEDEEADVDEEGTMKGGGGGGRKRSGFFEVRTFSLCI